MKLKIVGDAGTGKTTTILRYSREFNAMVLCHTRAAINVIASRDPRIMCSTLHSFALRFPDFSKFARKSLETGIEKIRMEFCAKHGIPYSTNAYIKKRGNHLFTAYSKLVNTRYPYGETDDFPKEVLVFAKEYERFKAERGYVDYEDMLKYLYDIAEKGELHIGNVIVDEAQDLSPLQFEIIRRSSDSIIAAGDELQSIFGFHGATPEIFESFGEKTVFLRKNYRIRSRIWEFAGEIVKSQLKRKRAEAVKEGGKVYVLPPASYREIAELANSIQGQRMVLTRYNEDAVFLRSLISDDVTVDTIHACKGDESSVVILVDGVEKPEKEGEEKRTWYVGATRCRDMLVIVPLKTRIPLLADYYELAEKTMATKVVRESKEIQRANEISIPHKSSQLSVSSSSS